MRRSIIAMAVGLSAPLFWVSGALAAQQLTTEDFVKTVAISDMFEIQSGQLAAEKAENGDVKSFGQQMVDDHSKTSAQLKELIKNKDVRDQFPDTLDQDHQARLDKLKGLSGMQFDKSYVDMQVKAHEKAVSLFEDYAAAGEDSALKAWSADTLPTLKNHLKEANDLTAKVNQMAAHDASDKADDRATRDENAMAMNNHDSKNAKAVHRGIIKYVTRQAPTDWTAEALIGRTVENVNGDNLGDINNVIINEKGDVVAVVIGVGGFLGIGEKNVGVPFDKLDFTTADGMKDRTAEPRDEKADRKAEAKQARFDTEHSDIRIVLNTTKEDLEAAPAFAWLDEQNSENAVVQ